MLARAKLKSKGCLKHTHIHTSRSQAPFWKKKREDRSLTFRHIGSLNISDFIDLSVRLFPFINSSLFPRVDRVIVGFTSFENPTKQNSLLFFCPVPWLFYSVFSPLSRPHALHAPFHANESLVKRLSSDFRRIFAFLRIVFRKTWNVEIVHHYMISRI